MCGKQSLVSMENALTGRINNSNNECSRLINNLLGKSATYEPTLVLEILHEYRLFSLGKLSVQLSASFIS